MISMRQMFREMYSQRTRILLTIFAIAWGTASISGMLAIGEGLRVSFMKVVKSGGKNLLFAQGGTTSISYHGMPKGQKINFDMQTLPRVKKIPAIEELAVIKDFTGNVSYKNRRAHSSPSAVSANLASMRQYSIQYGGRFINQMDIKNMRRVVFLGDKVAKWLFPRNPNAVGKEIYINGSTFKVIGVLTPSIQFQRVGAADSNRVMIPISTYQMLTNDLTYSMLVLNLRSFDYETQVKSDLHRIISKLDNISPLDTQAISFKSFTKSQNVINGFLIGLQVFLGIVGSVTLIVAGVGIANVMLMSVKKATRQIGIQMALGAQQSYILLHYLLESVLVTIAGGVIGVLITWLWVYLFSKVPLSGKIYDYMGQPRPMLSTGVLVTVLLTLGVIGAVAAYFPAKKAARVDPAEALRESG